MNPRPGDRVRVNRKRVIRTGTRSVEVFAKGDIVQVFATDAGMVRVRRDESSPIRVLRVVDIAPI